MTLKSDAKFEEKHTCGFKCDMKNLVNFHPITQKSENLLSMGFLWASFLSIFFLSRVYKVWAVKRSTLNSDLNKPWMDWGIEWTFIRALISLKGCTLVDCFCPKHVSARKCHRNNYDMTLKGDAKFNRKLTGGLKNDIKNLVNYHASSQKSEHLHFNGLLLFKVYNVWAKKLERSYVSWHWRVMQYLKKSWLVVWKRA